MSTSAILTQAPKFVVPVPSSDLLSGEVIAQSKLAKDYFMNSPDPSAGRTFEERTENLKVAIRKFLGSFDERRSEQYGLAQMTFSGMDWATNKQTPKTEYVSANTFIFFKIEKRSQHPGDWKGGPTIAGVDRSEWLEGDIPGGDVFWVTGGHHHAETYWTIYARYNSDFIGKSVAAEMDGLRRQLHELKIPTA